VLVSLLYSSRVFAPISPSLFLSLCRSCYLYRLCSVDFGWWWGWVIVLYHLIDWLILSMAEAVILYVVPSVFLLLFSFFPHFLSVLMVCGHSNTLESSLLHSSFMLCDRVILYGWFYHLVHCTVELFIFFVILQPSFCWVFILSLLSLSN